ncbi:MAG: M23 family metallopeptidase [Phormidesmis sp.]
MNYSISRLAPLFGLTAQLAVSSLVMIIYGLPARAQAGDRCPAALDRMRSHTVVAGDTLASIATAYRLTPNTLSRFNPSSSLAPGSVLAIPPFNGTIVSPSAPESWQSLAKRYGSRADVLFEVNGCVAEVPNRVFIPGAPGTTDSSAIARQPTATQQLVYPLAQPAAIARSYGWQPDSAQDELVFNSGIAFAINEPNDVRAAAAGTVAFAGEREGYGKLVVVNHSQGLQTRYANLSNVSVSVGQSVAAAAALGRVGKSEEPTFMYFEVRTNSSSGWIAQDPGKYVSELELR